MYKNSAFAWCNMTINQRLFASLQGDKTQQGLAEALNIKPQTISTWKIRGSDPPAKLIVAIADYLGMSVRYLLDGSGEAKAEIPANDSANVPDISDDARELLRIFFLVDVKRRHQILEVAFEQEEAYNQLNNPNAGYI